MSAPPLPLRSMPPTRRSLLVLRVCCALLVLGYALYVATAYRDGFARAARGERPLFTDFTTTYAAARLAEAQPAELLYDRETMQAAARAAGNAAYGGTLSPAQTDGIVGPWMYPPTLIPLVEPLARLPYHGALLAMLAVTAVPYLWAARAWFGAALPGVWLALAAPPAFFNVMFAQTSFLPAGLLALGLFWLPTRPLLAGAVIGLASVKPHLGALLPLVLIAGGHWRAFAAAAGTVLATVAASLLSLGLEPWFAFIGKSMVALDGFAANAYAWHLMPSVLSAAHWAGAPLETAWRLQQAVALAVAAIVVLLWWRGAGQARSHAARCAAVLAGAPLTVPMLFYYDLVILVPALACLSADLQARPGRRRALPALLAGALLLLPVKPLGALGVPWALACTLALFAWAVWRSALALRTATDSPAGGRGAAASPDGG